jgi:hypothetical protein
MSILSTNNFTHEGLVYEVIFETPTHVYYGVKNDTLNGWNYELISAARPSPREVAEPTYIPYVPPVVIPEIPLLGPGPFPHPDAQTPEPSTAFMLAIALVMAAMWRMAQ